MLLLEEASIFELFYFLFCLSNKRAIIFLESLIDFVRLGAYHAALVAPEIALQIF